MLLPLLSLYCIAAPCGYLVGQVYEDRHVPDTKDAWMAPLCAVFLPLAGVLAITMILRDK